jgi:DNA invertase Pin-like site-specific DNA recombinase
MLPMVYDDGGYSGGSLERPALQRLLADIEAGQIDVIVVYKVDRLTRALSDFAKLVEVFDRCGVSFVSITQQFNTTTSMGRLTLNILLSFAQFERELIGERVRDKIAASKKKGIWMGGTVPLGYDAEDRKLVINKVEARTVVDIYRRYLRVKSVRALQIELDTANIRSKRRVRPNGAVSGDQRFSQGALYLLLQNRTYRGEAVHKNNAYPGEHKAIIDKPLWDAVQTVLSENRIERASGTNSKAPSLLTGLLFDETGERLTPTWSVKKGKRYRYYVSTSLVKGGSNVPSTRRRIPAGDLETILIERLRKFLSSRKELLGALDEAHLDKAGHRQLIDRGEQTAAEFGQSPERDRAIIAVLVRGVEIGHDSIKIDVSRGRLAALLASDHIELPKDRPIDPSDHAVSLTAPIRLTRVGREMKLMIEDSNDNREPDMGLLRIIARAHDVQRRLAENTSLTVHDIARDQTITSKYLYILLRLRWLAPDITTAIVNGRQPPQLNAKRLMRLTAQLPADWSAQRALLGFR